MDQPFLTGWRGRLRPRHPALLVGRSHDSDDCHICDVYDVYDVRHIGYVGCARFDRVEFDDVVLDLYNYNTVFLHSAPPLIEYPPICGFPGVHNRIPNQRALREAPVQAGESLRDEVSHPLHNSLRTDVDRSARQAVSGCSQPCQRAKFTFTIYYGTDCALALGEQGKLLPLGQRWRMGVVVSAVDAPEPIGNARTCVSASATSTVWVASGRYVRLANIAKLERMSTPRVGVCATASGSEIRPAILADVGSGRTKLALAAAGAGKPGL